MEKINEMRIDFTAKSENEAFARIAMGAFLLPLNPTMEEMEDIRTAVSEAVTNAIVHGYRGAEGMFVLQRKSMRTVPFGWKLWIAALALPTLQRPGNRSTPLARRWSDPAWDLL